MSDPQHLRVWHPIGGGADPFTIFALGAGPSAIWIGLVNDLSPLAWAGAVAAAVAGLRAVWSQCTVLRVEDGILRAHRGWFPTGRPILELDLLDLDRIFDHGTTVHVVDVHGFSTRVADPLPSRAVAERVATFLEQASARASLELRHPTEAPPEVRGPAERRLPEGEPPR
jgi:hypothetical protein